MMMAFVTGFREYDIDLVIERTGVFVDIDGVG